MTWSPESLERLTEVVEVAAQYGPTAGLEEAYCELRRCALRALGQANGTSDWWAGDAAHQFFSPPTLDSLLSACGEAWPQRIESVRASLGAAGPAEHEQAVH